MTLSNSWATFIPLAAFLGIALVSWVVLSAFADRPTSGEERLKRIMTLSARPTGPSKLVKQQDRIQAQVAKAASRLSKPLRSKDEAERDKLRIKLMNAGFRGENAAQVFLGLKCLLGLVMLAVAAPLLYTRYGLTQTCLSYLLVAGSVGFYLPGVVVGNIAKKRSEAIFLGLPDALDLMVVCVEAGLGLDAAMRRVSSELAQSCPVICEEFAISNFQVQMGRPRKDVLRDMGIRTGVEDVRALAAVIIQAEKFGSSIGSALRVQSDTMRVRRRQLAEERAAKTAVKIMIPLILFIFPGVFVVLVGPAGIQIAKLMMGAH